jgi:hypothetical protein
MALLEVENLPADRKLLKLSLADVSGLDGHEIAVIGYPAFDPRYEDGLGAQRAARAESGLSGAQFAATPPPSKTTTVINAPVMILVRTFMLRTHSTRQHRITTARL